MAESTARETLELMLGHLGFIFELEESKRGDHVVFNILTRDRGRLIGRDAHTLDDLQYLLNRILHGHEDTPARIIVDVEGYRQKEQHDFLDRVRDVAERVKRSGQPETLPAMNSFDRRLVHQAFADNPDVRTHSEEGAGRLKHITIFPRTGKS